VLVGQESLGRLAEYGQDHLADHGMVDGHVVSEFYDSPISDFPALATGSYVSFQRVA
jgi:hypothetical protein